MALGILPIIELTVPQLYIIELKLLSEINKLITTVYNTSIDPLLHQLIAAKTVSTCILPTNLQSLSQIDIAALKIKENKFYYRGCLFILNLEDL